MRLRRWALLAVIVVLLAGLAVWQYRRVPGRTSAGSGISEAAATQMEQKLARLLEHAGNAEHAAGNAGSPAPTVLSEDEINSYFQYKLGTRTPKGVSEIQLDLHPDRPSGAAMVDFEQVKAASKKPVNPLLDHLLTGRKPISVAGRFTSSGGSGLFHLEQVSIGGLTLKGYLLDLVVRSFVLPRYPQVAIGRPFELPANIEQITVEEGRARIVQR